MQPWQSILLIIFTITIFGIGIYYDQIEKNTTVAYEGLLFDSESEKISSPNDENSLNIPNQIIDLQKSTAWAESKFNIKISGDNFRLLKFHKEAIMGSTFLESVIDTLNKNPTAKELIFSPFLNGIFIESELEILRSLFSSGLHTQHSNQLIMTIRGHSKKAADILARVLFENYTKALKYETHENPLLPTLVEKKKEILLLKKNYLQLAEQIQEENYGSSAQSIEEIALKSELMQIQTELNSHVNALQKIEKYDFRKDEYKELLTIHSLAKFRNVQELVANIEQLKSINANKRLKPILKSEITKNLTKLELSLENELAKGIEQIKDLSRSALAQKNILIKKIADLEIEKKGVHSNHPRFKLLTSVKKEMDEKISTFSLDFTSWELAKKNITLTKFKE